MGLIAALKLSEGKIKKISITMNGFLLLTTLASVALADPYYGYGHPYGYGPGIAFHPTGTSYTQRSPQGIGKRSAEAEPHYGYGQYAWPSATGYGFTSTCFGCRGKRSAEPSSYEYANPGVGSFTKVSAPYLFPHFVGPLTKRSAEADAEPHYGYAGYGYGLSGYSYARFGGHYLGKRSADAEPEAEAEADAEPGYYGHGYGYGGYGYGHHYGKRSAEPHYGYGLGVAVHPGHATSYVAPTTWGLGK